MIRDSRLGTVLDATCNFSIAINTIIIQNINHDKNTIDELLLWFGVNIMIYEETAINHQLINYKRKNDDTAEVKLKQVSFSLL